MKMLLSFFAVSMLLLIATVSACTTSQECETCTMGSSSHQFCNTDYPNDQEYNDAIAGAEAAGYVCE